MKTKAKILIPVVIAAVIYGISVIGFDYSQAQGQETIDVSAYLVGSGNESVTNGEYAVRFALYTVDRTDPDAYPSNTDAGNKIWEESQTLKVYDGVLNADLGSVSPLPAALHFSEGVYYLGIRIGEDAEMVPRKKVNAVPLAIDSYFLRGATIGTGAGNIPVLNSQGKLDSNIISSSESEITVSGSSYLEASGMELMAGAIDLSADVTGTLPVTSGGTGLSTIADGSVLYSSAKNKLTALTGTVADDGESLTFNWNGGVNPTVSWETAAGSGDIIGVGDVASGNAFTSGGSGSSLWFHSVANTGEISIAALTADRTYTLPNVSGAICTTGSICTGYQASATALTTTTAFGGDVSGTYNAIVVANDSHTHGVTTGGTGLNTIADGSILYANAANSLTALTGVAGDSGDFLRYNWNGGNPTLSWESSSGSFTSFNIAGDSGSDTIIDGDTLTISSGSNITTSRPLADTIRIDLDATLSGVTWNGNTISATRGGTGLAAYVTGDILYASAANTLSRLPAGSDGQILGVLGGIPGWQTSSFVGAHNLLSLVHPDTTAASPQPGDLITGINPGGGNKWQRYGIGAAGQILMVNGGGNGIIWNLQTSITQVGTITAGTWTGTPVTDAYVANALTIAGGAIGTSDITLKGYAAPISAEGRIEWDTVNDRIVVGTDASQAVFYSGAGAGGVAAGAGNVAGYASYWSGANEISGEQYLDTTRGGTGVGTFATNGVLYGNAAGDILATAAGSNGQLLVASAGSVPTFVTMTGDVNIAAAGATTIQLNSVALGTDTTNDYVASVTNGNGISGGNGGSESAALTLSLGNLTGNWSQAGAFDIVLANAGSELQIMESAGATFYGTFDVTDLTASRTYTFPDQPGTVAMTSDIHSLVTIAGESYLSLLGQQITAADVNLTTNVTGTLPVGNGGTGTTTFATNGMLYGNLTGAIQATTAGTSGQLLIASDTGVPTFRSMSGDVAITYLGATAIQSGVVGTTEIENSSVAEADINISNDPTDEYILKYDDTTGLTWIANTGGTGESKWTDQAGFTYLTDTGDDLVLGSSGTTNAKFLFDVSDSSVTFEGSSDDGNETKFVITNPTQDNVITFPDTTGTVVFAGGSGSSLWTNDGSITYLTETGDDMAVGGSTLASAFSVDISDNKVRIGDGADNNAVLDMYSSDNKTGSITYTTNDSWAFENGNFGIATTNPTSLFSVGASSQFQINSSGQIAAAAGIISSGSIRFSGLSTGIIHADGSGNLSSSAVNLAGSDVTGLLAVGNGGTGAGSFTTNAVLYGNSTSAIQVTNVGTSGQMLIASDTGVPTFRAISGDIGISYLGVTAIQSDAVGSAEIADSSIAEGDINISNGPADEYILKYDDVNGLTWIPNTGGSGESKWTDAGAWTYLASNTDDILIGGSTTDASAFFFDVSADTLTFEGTTPDANETILGVVDPDADYTINLPRGSGTIALTTDLHNQATLAGENYLTILGQQITASDISLTTNVSGILGAGNGGTGLNTSASSGIPTISAGAWTVSAALGVAQGGTGETSEGNLENKIEAYIFDADAENILGAWTVADNVALRFGTDNDIHIYYDETTNDRLQITDNSDNLLAALSDSGTNGTLYVTRGISTYDNTVTNAGDIEATRLCLGNGGLGCISDWGSAGAISGFGAAGQVAYWSGPTELSGFPQLSTAMGGTGLDTSSWTGLTTITGGVWSVITGEQGDIIYYNGTSWATLSHGSSGQYLETMGHSADPQWSTVTAHNLVTLNTTSHDYLSLLGQDITLGAIDISDDTNLAAGTLINLAGDTVSVKSSTLTDGRLCTYDTTNGLVCDTSSGSVGHTPVTIGSPANGLSVDGSQVVSLGLASTSTIGALSDTDWDIFNNKLDAEADTLDSVAGRGSATAVAISLQNASALTLGLDAATNTAGWVKLIGAGANNFSTVFTTATQTQDITYTLPPDDGGAGWVLTTSDGAGALAWSSSAPPASHTLFSHSDTTGSPASGDIIYRNGSSQWTRLAGSTVDNYALLYDLDTATPYWEVVASHNLVTLNTTSHDYLSLLGQDITLGAIDISDDTNLAGDTEIVLTGDALSIASSITRDSEWDTWAEHPALTSANILVGNASNQAAGVAMSGDISINNTGVTAIGSEKINEAMLYTGAVAPGNGYYLTYNSGTLGFSWVGSATGTAHGLLSSSHNVDVTPATVVRGGLISGQGASATWSLLNPPASGSGQLLRWSGSDVEWSAVSYPNAATGTGTILRADGTNWVASTATYPNTTTANQLLYSSSNNIIGGVTAGTSGQLLIASDTGVPTFRSMSSDMAINYLGAATIQDNAVDGTDISLASEAQGDVVYFNGTDWARLAGSGTNGWVLKYNTGTSAPSWAADTDTIYTAGNDIDFSGGGTQIDIEPVLDSVTTISRASSNLTLQTTTSGNIVLSPASGSDYVSIPTVGADLRIIGASGTYYGIFETAAITTANKTYTFPDATGEVSLLGQSIGLTSEVTGILPIANGGTGSNLTDPGADRVMFWDESAGTGGATAWLSLGNSLSISTTTLDTVQDIRTSASPTFAGLTLTGFSGVVTASAGVLGSTASLGVTLGGTGTTTQFDQGSIVFAGGSGVYSQDNSYFYYNSSTHRLAIGPRGAVAPQMPLHIFQNSLNQGIRLDRDGGTNYVDIYSDATGQIVVDSSAGSSSSALIIGDGATSGDLILIYDHPTQDYYIGIDEDDSDSLKIGSGQTVGTNTYITMSSAGNVGIGETNPSSRLNIKETITSTSGHTSFQVAPIISLLGGSAGDYVVSKNFSSMSVGNSAFTGKFIGTYNYIIALPAIVSLSNTYGVYNEMYNQGGAGGSVTNTYGTYNLVNNLSGTTGSAYASYNDIVKTSGTINNAYGVYVNDISTDATNAWAVYTNGSTKSYFGGSVGIGATNPYNMLEVRSSTTPQLRLAYDDNTNYMTTAVSSAGMVTFDANGGSAGFTFSDNILASANTVDIGSSGTPFDDFYATNLAINGASIDNDAGINYQTGSLGAGSTRYSAYNSLTPFAGTSRAYGLYNNLNTNASSNGAAYGMYNTFSSAGAGALFLRGIENSFLNAGDYTIGVRTYIGTINDASTQNVYGNQTYLTTYSGAADVAYGDYIISSGSTGGTLYGTYVDLSNGTATKYPGIFLGGNVGIGDASPLSLFTVGSGDLFQVDLNGDIVKLKNLTYAWPSAHTTNGVLTNGGTGTLTWGLIGASNITANSLDFTEFQDTLDLDAALTLNQTTNTWTQNFTGTTTTGLTYNATALTSGKLVDLQVSGTAAAASQTALNILTTGANGTAGITTYGAQISNTHSTNTSTNVALYLNASGGATANYGLIVNAGNVGIGTTAPTAALTFAAGSTINSLGALTINSDTTTALTLDSGTTGAVNIGNNANAKTITLGNVTGATAVNVNAGTGASTFAVTGTGTLTLGGAAATGIVTIHGGTSAANTLFNNVTGGTIAIGVANTGGITIGNGATAKTIAIGTGAAVQGITIGSTNSTSSLLLQGGTGNVQLQSQGGTLGVGNNAVAQTITLGNVTGATAVNVNTGTAGTTYTTTNGIFTLNTGTGTISLGTDAVAKTITLGNVTGATAVNVNAGTGASTFAVTGTGTLTLGGAAATGIVTIHGGTSAANTLFNNVTGGTIAIGVANTGGITIGNGATAKTIAIGTGAAVQGITIGSTNSTSSLLLQGGTGNVQLQSQGGTLGVGNNAVAQTINIGNGTGATAVSVLCGSGTCGFGNNAVDHSTTLGSVTGTSLTTLQSGTGGINIIPTGTGIVNVGTGAAAALVVDSAGNVGIGTASPGTKLAVNGLTGTASYNLVRVDTATGNFYYDTSTARNKLDIQDYHGDFLKILSAEPKSFTDKASSEREIGYIAEDFAKIGLNNLIIYGQDNLPVGLKYDKIPLYLTEVVKQQQGQIGELTTDNSQLNSSLISQNSQISQIILKTDQNITTLSDLQKSVDKNLAAIQSQLVSQGSTLEGAITDLRLNLQNHETKIKSIENLMSTIQAQIDAIKEATNTELILARLDENKTDIDYIKLVLGLDRAENGSLNLLGNLEAEGIVAGVFTVKISDEDRPTIGGTTIWKVDTDENSDGIDDTYGTDGKSAEVETKAVSATAKIFTSFADNPGAYSWVEKTKDNDGNYTGFKIMLSERVSKDVKVSWWIVEAKGEGETTREAVSSTSEETPAETETTISPNSLTSQNPQTPAPAETQTSPTPPTPPISQTSLNTLTTPQ